MSLYATKVLLGDDPLEFETKLQKRVSVYRSSSVSRSVAITKQYRTLKSNLLTFKQTVS
jgi:hypothetical protein